MASLSDLSLNKHYGYLLEALTERLAKLTFSLVLLSLMISLFLSENIKFPINVYPFVRVNWNDTAKLHLFLDANFQFLLKV